MKFLFELNQFFINALRLSYSLLNGGEECIICGKKTYFPAVCTSCKKSFFDVSSFMHEKRCKKCGKILFLENDICLSCREAPLLNSTDSVFPLFSYRLWNKELMFLWKMQGLRSLSSMFAKIINDVLNSFGEKNAFIVPVPPRKGKIAEKGWDQIEDLCLFLEKRYSHRICRLLQRNSDVQQKKLNRDERLSKIQSAYKMKDLRSIKKILNHAGKEMMEKVYLIDDVCTTGSTIESCARALKDFGIKKVNVITLFIVD